ncbi:MAG: carboxynorspermidine decarboxylase [Defluviitaleaceae bacterium]|nr:carboxynorspermidine decarboxylase [Defluviitaleaceae bacterium]
MGRRLQPNPSAMMIRFDPNQLPSPCYIVDEQLLAENLRTLRWVADEAGCKILLAQKAFSMFSLYPLIARHLDGTTSSGLHEALLSRDYMGKENHVFSAAYSDEEFAAVSSICSHIVFNSFSQWDRFKDRAAMGNASLGIRINPELSTQEHGGIYDPCSRGSRLGVTLKNFRFDAFDERDEKGERDEIRKKGKGIDGIHFHTLCQQNSDALELTLQAVEEKFSACFDKISWINMGGGHHITREDYDKNKLISLIKNFKQKYKLDVYIEPGEAIALNAGFLVCTVLDIIENNGNIAILDTSAACHMPDVLEMPYRPRIIGAGEKNKKPHSYKLGAPTCLAGDFIGEYSFDKPLSIGDKLIFEDMAIYSMVKNNTFNGINLPSIAICHTNGELEIVKKFGYEDFRDRLS